MFQVSMMQSVYRPRNEANWQYNYFEPGGLMLLCQALTPLTERNIRMGLNHQHEKQSTGNIRIAFFLNLCFTILEIIGGLWTNSVAILSDALHDLGDSFSLGLAWYLNKYSNRKADEKFSYGYRRFSLLAALINTIVLIIGAIFILSEILFLWY